VIHPQSPPVNFQFGGFYLDGRRRLLLSRSDGSTVALPTKSIDLLLYLVERAGEVVEKAALIRAVWPNVHVEENSLSQCISALRRALGEDPSDHQFIVTAPGRGYRFIADVQVVAPERPASRRPDTPGGAVRRSGVTVHSLAVLPFKPLAKGDGIASLELGMTDALIMRIGGLRNLIISPLSSVRRYGALGQDPIAAGKESSASHTELGSASRRSKPKLGRFGSASDSRYPRTSD